MENLGRGKLALMKCDSGIYFAEKVAEELEKIVKRRGSNSVHIVKTKEIKFSNTEIKTEIDESVRDQDVYIIQDNENKTNGLSVNDNFMALKTAIQAARMADAHYITAVVPAFPYARQDKPKTREGITAAMIARELEDVGATRVITLDIHDEAIGGFFRKATLENLRASKTFLDYIKDKIGKTDLVMVAPDVGGAERANFYAKKLDVGLALIHKQRDYSKVSKIENMSLIGEVKDKNVFVIDDIIDTAGTLTNASMKLKDEGAKDVYFAASLALFNGPAVERISEAYAKKLITKVIGTNVVFHGKDFLVKNKWYDEVHLEKYFAQVIDNINRGESISQLLK